jgi:hypothetical protein
LAWSRTALPPGPAPHDGANRDWAPTLASPKRHELGVHDAVVTPKAAAPAPAARQTQADASDDAAASKAVDTVARIRFIISPRAC